MKKINFRNENVRTEGIYGFDKEGKLRRYTDEIVKLYPRLEEFDRRCTGARIRFKTDSAHIRAEINVSNRFVDRGMSFYQANVGYAYAGEYSSSVFRGILSADSTYDSDVIAIDFENAGLNDITVFFPRNAYVDDINIYIDDTAVLLPPAPHKVKLPFVFYGSSITEQGLTSTPFAYATLLSRFFDADFYNFGASGNARGEKEIARLIGGIKKSVFFYDYDHNAPTAEHLQNTHEAFFKAFRELDPLTPVIMTSRPSNDTPDFSLRESIVRTTYENAVKAGDKNVYFIPGRLLYGDVDAQICATDVTHPNDLGHYLMAKTLEKCVRENGLV